MKNYHLALVGENVSSSPSPRIHQFIMQSLGASCSYETLSLPAAEFPRVEELFSSCDGFNVTMPYKRSILPFLKRLDKTASALSSVNTVKCCGRVGFNTDQGGFTWLLQSEHIVPSLAMRVLILGAGGAGRSVIHALSPHARVFVYEKEPLRLQAAFSDLGGFTPLQVLSRESFDFIVNCTGVGMHESQDLPRVRTSENAEETPFDETFFSGCDTAIDLIYDPASSAFLNAAKAVGARGVNGMKMLFFQAYLADCIFWGREGSFAEANEIQRQFEAQP